MFRKLKAVSTIIAAAGLAVGIMAQPVRYEAQNAVLDNSAESNSAWHAVVASSPSASGGQYVRMNGGGMTFNNVAAAAAGPHKLWISYSQTYGDAANPNKTQNLVINGTTAGDIVFPPTGPANPTFVLMSVIVPLRAGSNTIAITRSWGWVDIDYIAVEPFVDDVEFNISNMLVNPNASENALKMYRFIRDNFGNKTISGVMTNEIVNRNFTTQPEIAHVRNASGGKEPAMIGLDFMHSTGLRSNESWFQQYSNGTLALAEDVYNRGGISIYMWHWKDPNKASESGAFYTENTNFRLHSAFNNPSNPQIGDFNVESESYKNIIADIDHVSGLLKTLADKEIPVLWRPLHEAAGHGGAAGGGAWFWWGSSGATANKALWLLMYDRMTNHHGLNNLIWVWTCQGGSDALDWYPGHDFVDIIGKDIYADAHDYGSQMPAFASIKSVYEGRKIIALAENGPIPDPDFMISDGAPWSWFMPWYAEFTTQQNSNAHWNKVMNHDFVITMSDMPGWANVSVYKGAKAVSNAAVRMPVASVRGKTLNVKSPDNSDLRIRMVNMSGRTAANFRAAGSASFSLKNVPAGRYIVEIKASGKRVSSSAVIVK